MSNLETRITQHFQTMQLPLDETLLKDYSYREKEKYLETILDRMQYLYNRLRSFKQATQSKFRLEKDEFRALEWLLWEVGLIKSEERFKTVIGQYQKSNSPAPQQTIRI